MRNGKEIIQQGPKMRALLLVCFVFVVALSCGSRSEYLGQSDAMDESSASGTLTGKVVREPSCAAITEDFSCPLKPAGDVTLIIFNTANEEVGVVSTNDQGLFRISLPEGTYRVEVGPLPGIEFTKDLPATVMITAAKKTHLSIHIDTGIR